VEFGRAWRDVVRPVAGLQPVADVQQGHRRHSQGRRQGATAPRSGGRSPGRQQPTAGKVARHASAEMPLRLGGRQDGHARGDLAQPVEL